jgi:hypothetical protein
LPKSAFVSKKLTTQSVSGADVAYDDTIPPNWGIKGIFIEETAGSDAGNVSIGSSTAAFDIIEAATISANETNYQTFTEPLLLHVDNETTIYVNSDAWGDGEVNITVMIIEVTS